MRTPKSQQVLERLLDPEVANRLWEKFCWKTWFKLHNKPEPDWAKITKQSGLPPQQAERFVAGLKRLGTWPFFCDDGARALLEFCFKELPKIDAECAAKNDRQRGRLCSMLRFLMVMVLQARAIYPRNPVEVATQLLGAIKSRVGRQLGFGLLSEMLTEESDGVPSAGWNAVIAQDQDRLLAYENKLQTFRPFERSANPLPKYVEYRQRLLENRRFHADWKLITDNFRLELDQYARADGVILPTWHRRVGPAAARRKGEFFLLFDFFCWKWFLHGMIWSRKMKRGMPLVEEPHFKLTPVGTEVFIPGYWSLDKTRDGLWNYVVDLHKARGVPRQGAKLADNRKDRIAQLKKLLLADQEARAKKFRGETRHDHLKHKAGLHENTDLSQVYRMLREAKRLFPASHAQP